MVNNPNAIMTQEQVAIDAVKRLVNIVRGLSNEVFEQGVDFGVIPGTGDKPTLLQPGMEKLLKALHLRAEYVERSKVEDFEKGLFFYRYECRLIDWETGICVGTAIGSANSYESKWRWRDQKRTCPKCGKEAILKSKFPDRNTGDIGWWCNSKNSGCGANFVSTDPQIVNQSVGRVENPDLFDQMNTCDKIAQKRSLGSAIKTVANVSMLYTIDLEDFQPFDTASRLLPENTIEGQFAVVEHTKTTDEPSAGVRGAGVYQPPQTIQEEVIVRPDESEDPPPNLNYADAFIVSMTRTAKSYAVRLKSGAVIAVKEMALLDGLSIGDRFAVDLERGTYPLMPAWRVFAEADVEGWRIDKIDAALPA